MSRIVLLIGVVLILLSAFGVQVAKEVDNFKLGVALSFVAGLL